MGIELEDTEKFRGIKLDTLNFRESNVIPINPYEFSEIDKILIEVKELQGENV